jgi:hypothetical protein
MFQPAFEGHICSLGYALVDWLQEYACHGPGDVQGEPLDFSTDPEVEDFIVRAYELDPRPAGARSRRRSTRRRRAARSRRPRA